MKVCLQCHYQYDADCCPACQYRVPCINGFDAYAPEFAHAGGGFKAVYFAELAQLEAANFWFRARNNLVVWALQKFCSALKSILEVGCGTGFVLSGIAASYDKARLHGSEIFVAGLAFAAERLPTAHFMQMDARQVPFVAHFEAIGAFDVLEHIEEDEVVLAQLHQALEPSGRLFITVPQHRWLWSAADEHACHVRRYSRREIHDKLLRAGFSIEYSTSFVTLLLPAMLLSRLGQKKVQADYDPQNELKLPRVLNALFYGLMQLEFGLIKLGLNLPIGGSRLVVAKKL